RLPLAHHGDRQRITVTVRAIRWSPAQHGDRQRITVIARAIRWSPAQHGDRASITLTARASRLPREHHAYRASNHPEREKKTFRFGQKPFGGRFFSFQQTSPPFIRRAFFYLP
ncbi:MAG TPA: hypothetical protein PL077_05130, partial [Treponemataceae bacterium]|nr:hypothetical protein [Treponemataceae bacterium]